MKFTWFNLMPWPSLPDNFREEHHSVWVDIPNRLYDPHKGHFVYHEYMDQLEYADSLGYDGIGVNEHHQNGYGLMPSPNIIAAGLARRTSQAALAVIGNSLALVQSATSGCRRICHAGRHFRRTPAGRISGWDLDGHQLLLRARFQV